MFLFWFQLVSFPGALSVHYNKETFDKQSGVICDFEVVTSSTGVEISPYLCMPASQCQNSQKTTLPLAALDRCYKYFKRETPDSMKCCHVRDIINNTDPEINRPKTYLPGLKSYIKCKHYQHAVCSNRGANYCEETFYSDLLTEPSWAPTNVQKYPYLVQLGYRRGNSYVWSCLGNIISENFILTAASCQKPGSTYTHVRVGVDRECESCPDVPQAQILQISQFIKHPQHYPSFYYFDIALVELKDTIVFNKHVRPACLLIDDTYTEENTRYFSNYGKEQIFIKTGLDTDPVFMPAPDDGVVKIRVKGRDARVVLSKQGRPYIKEPAALISLSEKFTTLKRSWRDTSFSDNFLDHPFLVPSSYKSFWIKYTQDSKISVGRNDTVGHNEFLSSYIRNPAKRHQISAVGLSSTSETDWIFRDKQTGFSIHAGELVTLPTAKCREELGLGVKLDETGFHGDIMYCANDPYQSFTLCNEDGGGGLVTHHDNTYCMWHVLGVFARTDIAECTWKKPFVFTKVSFVLDWIENIVWKKFNIGKMNFGTPFCAVQPKANYSSSERC